MNAVIHRDLEEIYDNTCIENTTFDHCTILITGAYGMLASYLVYYFMYLHDERGVDLKLICLVKSANKYYKRFEPKDYVELVESDLLALPSIDSNVDYIIHAASPCSPQLYSVAPVDVISPNVIGNYNILDLAVRKNVKGYLLLSTCSVYGRVDDKRYITEKDYGYIDPLATNSCYSESKRLAETMCKAFYTQYGVPVKIVRISHAYAPTMNYEYGPRVFESFVRNIVRHEDIVIKSDGKGKRPFCYATDAIRGCLTVLIHGVPGEAYNITNESQYMSVSDLANVLVDLYPDRELKVVYQTRTTEDHYTENIYQFNHEQIPVSTKLEKLGGVASLCRCA